MGFSLGRLDDAVDAGAWLTVVRGPSGAIRAFSSWLPLGPDGIALDLVRRHPQAPAGAMDLCLAETLEKARRRGLRVASLGSVPCRDANLSAPDGRLARRVRAALYRRGIGGYQYVSLARFKDKFAPTWVDRDVALPRGLAAARVLVALLAVHRGGSSPRRPASAASPVAERWTGEGTVNPTGDHRVTPGRRCHDHPWSGGAAFLG